MVGLVRLRRWAQSSAGGYGDAGVVCALLLWAVSAVSLSRTRTAALASLEAKLYFGGWGGVSTHNSRVVQGSTVLSKS